MIRIVASLTIALACVSTALAQQNTVVFDNRSGEPALIKLIGPTNTEIQVPNAARAGLYAPAGRYVIKVRYGTPGKYRYSKIEEHEVKEKATTKSEITVTLHKAGSGNDDSKSISETEFGTSENDNQPPDPITGVTPGASKSALQQHEDAVPWINKEGVVQTKKPLPKGSEVQIRIVEWKSGAMLVAMKKSRSVSKPNRSLPIVNSPAKDVTRKIPIDEEMDLTIDAVQIKGLTNLKHTEQITEAMTRVEFEGGGIIELRIVYPGKSATQGRFWRSVDQISYDPPPSLPKKGQQPGKGDVGVQKVNIGAGGTFAIAPKQDRVFALTEPLVLTWNLLPGNSPKPQEEQLQRRGRRQAGRPQTRARSQFCLIYGYSFSVGSSSPREVWNTAHGFVTELTGNQGEITINLERPGKTTGLSGLGSVFVFVDESPISQKDSGDLLDLIRKPDSWQPNSNILVLQVDAAK